MDGSDSANVLLPAEAELEEVRMIGWSIISKVVEDVVYFDIVSPNGPMKLDFQREESAKYVLAAIEEAYGSEPEEDVWVKLAPDYE